MPEPYIEALLRERRGYEVRGLTDRIAAVDKALAAAGYTRADAKKAPAKERATKATAETRQG